MSAPRRWAWIAGRLALAAFCWMTALYAFITSSAFAYLQFIRPRVFPWVGQLADWHRDASLAWLVLLAMVLWRDLRGLLNAGGFASVPRRAGVLSVALLALAAAACSWNLRSPILPGLTEGPRSLAAGVLSLVPLVWLALVDQVRAAAYLRWQRPPEDELEVRAFEGRLLAASITTAVFLTVLYAALASLSLAARFEPDLLTSGLARGFAASLVSHLAVLIVPFVLMALIVRATRGRFVLQYVLVTAVFVGVFAVAFARLVGDALGLHGASAVLAAVMTGASIVGTWTGLRLRTLEAGRQPLDSSLDLYFGQSRRTADGGSPWGMSLASIARFLAVGACAYATILVSSRIDWDFAVLNTGVLVVWLTTQALVYQRTPFYRDLSDWALAAACALPLAAAVAIGSSGSMRGPLDRYAVYNPSFRLADALLGGDGRESSTFDRYLRAHTGLTDVTIAPIDLDFVQNLGAAPAPPPPMFLFVIDSLRPDYLAPYNPTVRFTPRIAEFAADSVVFTNAITRYGGTGLSVPAMWAGAAIVHKQYVTPFHPMNTLEKLLDANGYLKFLGLDSIMQRLLVPSPSIDELDHGRPVMDYEFCRTLDELQVKLAAAGDSRPAFAYTLPQDIHMSRLPRTVESDEDFRSFYTPYAAKVRALDACFGRFIDALKQRNVYDGSLIVVTADHGEMLGEDGRFGHSYHLFPQIIQVPLIVHLPASMARTASIDADAVSLTTDITPTMYAALGYDPVGANALMGRSLIASTDQVSTARRRDAYVVAASYGAVYAVARHNARRLYIADAVRGGDQAFERDQSGRWNQVAVTAGLRAVNQFAIRRHVDELARMYDIGDRK